MTTFFSFVCRAAPYSSRDIRTSPCNSRTHPTVAQPQSISRHDAQQWPITPSTSPAAIILCYYRPQSVAQRPLPSIRGASPSLWGASCHLPANTAAKLSIRWPATRVAY